MIPEKRPVTLEDLLRLKRAERPAAEFWEQFDRDLRAKQLAAIVEKRPWWRSVRLPAVFARGVRFYLPVGATAALAVALFVTQSDQPEQAAPAVPQQTVAAVVAPTPEGALDVDAPASVRSVTAPALAVADASSAPAPLSAAPAVVTAAAETVSSDAAMQTRAGDVAVSDAAPVLAEPATVSEALALATLPVQAETLSGRFVAANLATETPHDDLLASVGQLLQPRLAEVKVRPAKIEPLAQIQVPGSSRTNKILSARVSAISHAPDSTRSSERAANRLSGDSERIYDRGQSRIGGSASTFSFRL